MEMSQKSEQRESRKKRAAPMLRGPADVFHITRVINNTAARLSLDANNDDIDLKRCSLK